MATSVALKQASGRSALALAWRSGAAMQKAADAASHPLASAPADKPLPEAPRLVSFAQPEFHATLQSTVDKSFKLHLGGNISIPTRSAKYKPELTPVQAPQKKAAGEELIDPFEGLPFRGFAEKMGAAVMPAVQAMREEQRQAELAMRQQGAAAAVVEAPPVPHFLPFTRWAANNERIRSTFIAEEPKNRKKVRLSWYHPDDGMVPRGWFKQGLLADIAYYSPFSKPEPAQQQATQ